MWSSTRRAFAFCALALAIFASSSDAFAAPAKAAAKVAGRARPGKAKGKGPQSIGAPNGGRLAGASRLRGSKHLRQREGAHSWGLPQLTHLLHKAATDVARRHRGSQMLVGDLSGRTGGRLDGHNSHQSGRDVDVGFYVMNVKGKPVAVKHFVAFDDHGNGRELGWAHFDEARNWAMVESLLKDDKASVRYIFVTNGLRARLLAHATKKHVSKEILARAASVMMSPRDADLHDDHFHVRIACPESMRDVCTEESSTREPAAAAEKVEPAKPDAAAAVAPDPPKPEDSK
jgi:penicillin-insensitive murein endopeptidase